MQHQLGVTWYELLVYNLLQLEAIEETILFPRNFKINLKVFEHAEDGGLRNYFAYS